jgi:hypothetical protein
MTLHENTTQAGAVVALLVRGGGRAVSKRDNAGARQRHARKGNRAWVSVGRPRPVRAHGLNSRGRSGVIPGKPMTGRKDGHHTAARESAGAGGFDSRSLAEIVVKDGVQIPDCGASRLASALGVEGGLTAGKDRHQQLLTRRLLVVCFSAPNE